jgi:hypothetical protein
MQESISVAIPVYRPTFPLYEAFALKHNTRVLNKYPVVLVAPESLDCGNYLALVPDARIIRFDDSFFRGTDGYNELCLSSRFWQAFKNFSHVLICQLDALVFSDQIQTLTCLGIDYIGSAVCKYDIRTGIFIRWITSQNGGLSLRNVQGHLRLLQSRRLRCLLKERYAIHKDLISSTQHEDGSSVCQAVRGLKFVAGQLLGKGIFNHIDQRNDTRISQRVFIAEDQFWSRLAPKFGPECFRVAELGQAQAFGFQNGLERLVGQYHGQPPFGCHGPEKVQAFHKFLCLEQYPTCIDELRLWDVAQSAGLVPALRAGDVPAELGAHFLAC